MAETPYPNASERQEQRLYEQWNDDACRLASQVTENSGFRLELDEMDRHANARWSLTLITDGEDFSGELIESLETVLSVLKKAR